MDDESHASNNLERPGSPYPNNNKNSNKNSSTTSSSSKEQDRFLPIANVGRIMKKVIPGNGKISKDAKETVQECVSEFISFVTGEACDKCQREKRKTINGDDIIWAITTLGFEDYANPLKIYLNKYREVEDVPKQQRSDPSPTQPPPPPFHRHHQRLLQHQQQHHHDQFQPLDQGLSPYLASVYSSTTLVGGDQPSFAGPPQPSFVGGDQPFSLPLSLLLTLFKRISNTKKKSIQLAIGEIIY